METILKRQLVFFEEYRGFGKLTSPGNCKEDDKGKEQEGV